MKIGQSEIDLNELSGFLVKAKKASYANPQNKKSVTLPDGSKQFLFRQRRFYYTDIYIGHSQFSGTETVEFDTEIPESRWATIWKMNYFGRIHKKFKEDPQLIEKTYGFLRQALSNVQPIIPFRGPFDFLSQDNNLRYSFTSDSGLLLIDAFEGIENITSRDKGIIYSGNCHGGIIIPK